MRHEGIGAPRPNARQRRRVTCPRMNSANETMALCGVCHMAPQQP